MISLIVRWVFTNNNVYRQLKIPPKDQIPRVTKMLADEFGTASNIKSRVNRLSVLGDFCIKRLFALNLSKEIINLGLYYSYYVTHFYFSGAITSVQNKLKLFTRGMSQIPTLLH